MDDKKADTSTVASECQCLISLHSSVNGHICHCHFVRHSARVNKTEHASVLLRRCNFSAGDSQTRRPQQRRKFSQCKSLLNQWINLPSKTSSDFCFHSDIHFTTSCTDRKFSNCHYNSSPPSLFQSFRLYALVIFCICCSLVHCESATAHFALPSSSKLPSVNNFTNNDYLTLAHQIRSPYLYNNSKTHFNLNLSTSVSKNQVITHLNDENKRSNETTNTNVSSLKLKRSNDPNEVIESAPSSTHPLNAVNEEEEEEEEEEEDEEEEKVDNELGGNKRRQFKAEDVRSGNNGEQKSGIFGSHSQPTGSNDNVDYVMHSPRTVNTKYGALQGIVITFVRYDSKSTEKPIPPPSNSMALSPVEAFLGVPYASPPSGSLRFMPPVAPVHWRGVRQANHLSPVCPQTLPKMPAASNASSSSNPSGQQPTASDSAEQLSRNMSQRYFERLTRKLPYLQNQSEDCLTLNIYVPFEQYYQQRHTFRAHQKNSQSRANRNRHKMDADQDGSGKSSSQANASKYPVIVFIHGDESYDSDSGNSYDGSIWASYGRVILVTLNYRLGVLGFLPAHVEGSVRGNYALMDQVAALHYVKENIAEFGGNPDNVTVIGHAFGAACVHLLMLSPMAKGLFSRAALMSGSALAPSAIARDAENYAVQLAKEFNCPVYDNVQLVECLKRKSIDELQSVNLDSFRFLSAFGPIVDGIVVPYEPRLIMESLAYGANAPSSSSSSSSSASSSSKSSQANPAGHVFAGDILFGVTRVQSPLGLFSAYDERYGIDVERRNQVLRTLVRNMFDFHQQTILWTLINEYTDWSRPAEHPINLLDSTLEILTDALVVSPLIESMELFAKASLNNAQSSPSSSHSSRTSNSFDFLYRDPNAEQTGANRLYFYVFQNQNDDPIRLTVNQRLGSMHGDELDYLFGAPIAQVVTGHSIGHLATNLTRPTDVSLSEAFITYFSNFAKFGNPNFVSSSDAFAATSSVSSSAQSSESSFSSASSGTAPHSVNYGAPSAQGSSAGHGVTADQQQQQQQQQKQLLARFEQLNWPPYSVAQRRFLMIGSKCRVRDHYHSHRLSFWLNLIPRLMLEQYSHRRNDHDLLDVSELMADAFDKDEDIGRRYMQHHLLDNFDDAASYDGPVRQITWKNLAPSRAKYGVSTGTGWLRTSLAGSSLLQMNADQSAAPSQQMNDSTGLLFSLRSKTTSHTALQNGNKLNLFASTNSGAKNFTENQNNSGDNASYSVALSVVVAIGLSLLVLNMLVFAGVYYLDRHREKRTNSALNNSQMYSVNGAKHYEPNSLNSKSASSGSSTLTNINEHNEATNYIHYTTNNAPCEDGQLLSIKSSAVHQLDNGGQNGLASLSPLSSLTVHDDYGTRMHHVHYLEAAEPSSSSGSVGTHSHQTSNYNHHHHHHHLISPNETGDSSDPSAQAALMLSASPSANTPTVSYYPLHSFTTAGNANELIDTGNIGRTSRIRFSLDSESTSQYMLEQNGGSSHHHQQQQQQQQQPVSILTTVPSSTDARSVTLKRVKI